MKIAIASEGKNLESNISQVFGRCPYFLIVQIEKGKITKTETIENIAANQLGQAGTTSVQMIAEKGIDSVIAENIGPRVSDALKQLQIGVYQAKGSIQKALENFIAGKLEKIQ